MLIDLHCHTSASDGALDPADIIDRALAAGIRVLAITDHDSVAGYQSAARYYTAKSGSMKLVSGLECSCRWSGVTVHIVGLDVDCSHPVLQRALRQLDQARLDRGRKIARRLAHKGYAGAFEGARLEAGESQLGRPHFAQWMVRQGHVRDVGQAFERYLGHGKLGDVKAFWPELEQVVHWIGQAGGIAVLAHPLKYRMTRTRLRRLLQAFADAGGDALEVCSGRQQADQLRQLCLLAREFELQVSAGSDFHRDSTYGPQLGVELPEVGDLQGVWRHWQD